ncbi:MAG: hypothetical protein BGN88_09900 [Clostridiales bacterium 43-6]|nr:MAG: hypothetical protein BGN88_09900 [Clostridiales bacterium 43-6]
MKYQNKVNNINRYNIAVISNISFDLYITELIEMRFKQNDIHPQIINIPFDEYKLNKYKSIMKNANMIVIILNFESLYRDLIKCYYLNNLFINEYFTSCSQQCITIYNYIKYISVSPIIWFGFEDYFTNFHNVNGALSVFEQLVDKLNNYLNKIIKQVDTFIDFKYIIARVGINNSYDNKGKYRWNAPYSKDLTNEISYEIYKQYLINNGITKKCIILDCDNVLWGGILSEDGIEKINLGCSGLGRAFQDFQKYLLYLYYHGVILAINSKNNLLDVMQMFREHSEMVLKEEHIACFQVNWDNKPDNIKKIAKQLNISLDSIVFIDDSDFEIQSVKSLLPNVTTIRYERDTVYVQLSCFNLKSNIDIEKVEKRNNTYKSNEQRDLLKAEHHSFEEYLQALEMQIDIHKTLPIEYNRIAELTQRTNKCTNGKRYTVDQLKEQLNKGTYHLYSVSVFDKFSDLGLVGVFGINNTTLDLFSLSCRALGRKVEDKMIEYIYDNFDINEIFFLNSPNNKEIFKFLNKEIYKKGEMILGNE